MIQNASRPISMPLQTRRKCTYNILAGNITRFHISNQVTAAVVVYWNCRLNADTSGTEHLLSCQCICICWAASGKFVFCLQCSSSFFLVCRLVSERDDIDNGIHSTNSWMPTPLVYVSFSPNKLHFPYIQFSFIFPIETE